MVQTKEKLCQELRKGSCVQIKLNERLLLLQQGTQEVTFQLEVWSKTEDVVQTLLQVCV